MKKLLKFLLSLVITGAICGAVYELYPGIQDKISDTVLPISKEEEKTDTTDISYTAHPSVNSLDELKEFIIDHRDLGITEFSFIYSGTEILEPLMLAEIYGASHIAWTKQGSIYTVTVTEFPGDKIVKAYRSGDDSMLNSDEKQALQRAVSIVESLKAQTEDSMALELGIYEALCEEITYYTDELLDTTSSQRPRYVSVVGALLDGMANCQGYTDAFYTLGSIAGFQIGRLSVETPTLGHMVNTIYLNNQWYIVDVTYGDSDDAPANYRLFNVGMDMVGEYWWNRELEPYPIAETTDENLNYYYVRNLVFDDIHQMADYLATQWFRSGQAQVSVMLRGEPDGSLLRAVLYDCLSTYNESVSYRIFYHSNGTDTFYTVLYS